MPGANVPGEGRRQQQNIFCESEFVLPERWAAMMHRDLSRGKWVAYEECYEDEDVSCSGGIAV